MAHSKQITGQSMLLALALGAAAYVLLVTIGSAIAQPGDAGALAGAAAIGEAPAISPAPPAVPSPDADAAAWAAALIAAIKSGQWLVAVGLVLVAGVWVARSGLAKRWAWFESKPGGLALALFASIGGAIGTALAAGAPVNVPLVLGAVGAFLAASGAWGLIKDYLEHKGWLAKAPA